MKINELTQIQQTKTDRKSKPSEVSGFDFQELLEDQIQSLSNAKKTSKTAPTQPVQQISPSLRIESIALTESALNHLDSYGQALANLKINSEDLEPHISLLEQDTSALLELRGHLPADDPLALLLDRVSAVTFLEASKYRRGDYHN